MASKIDLLVEVLKDAVEDAKEEFSLLEDTEYWESGSVIKTIPVTERKAEGYKPLYFR